MCASPFPLEGTAASACGPAGIASGDAPRAGAQGTRRPASAHGGHVIINLCVAQRGVGTAATVLRRRAMCHRPRRYATTRDRSPASTSSSVRCSASARRWHGSVRLPLLRLHPHHTPLRCGCHMHRRRVGAMPAPARSWSSRAARQAAGCDESVRPAIGRVDA